MAAAARSSNVSTQLPGAKGSSTPVFLQPDAGKIGAGFDFLQPRTGVGNQLQADAVGEQQNLGSILGSLLGDTRSTREGEIQQGFQAAGDLASNQLSSRGIDPSLLGAQTGIQREQGLSLGDLNDQLSQQRISGETDIANSISQLLLGSSEQAGGLLASLLGAGWIGSVSSSSSTNPVSLGEGGSGSGGGSDPFNPFPGGSSLFGTRDQGNPGGGGGGGSPLGTTNPFVNPPGGPGAPDPSTPEGYVPPRHGALEDGGPIDDPIRHKKNQEELTRRNAELEGLLNSLPGSEPPTTEGGF